MRSQNLAKFQGMPSPAPVISRLIWLQGGFFEPLCPEGKGAQDLGAGSCYTAHSPRVAVVISASPISVVSKRHTLAQHFPWLTCGTWLFRNLFLQSWISVWKYVLSSFWFPLEPQFVCFHDKSYTMQGHVCFGEKEKNTLKISGLQAVFLVVHQRKSKSDTCIDTTSVP